MASSLEKEVAVPGDQAENFHKEEFQPSSDTLRASSESSHEGIPEAKLEEPPSDDVRDEEFHPPNGGPEAWLLVAAGFFVFVNTWGITSTFGAFSAFYQKDLLSSESSSAIQWVGSVQAFLVVFLGIIVGPLFDRGYLRPLVFTGCFLTVLGMMMTSISTKYYQIFLAQAICVGFGEGITYVPSLALIATYFTTKRPIAIGIASLGSVVGGIIFPIMFRKLQPQIGFGWSIRAIGFINLGLALMTLAILGRHPGRAHEARSLLDFTALREPPFVLFSLGLFFVYLAYYVPLFFIVSYARIYLHTSEDFAFYLLAITNGGSLFGRTVPYLLGQRVKPIYTLLFSSLIGVILIFAWIGVHGTAGFVVWCVLWGFVAGVLVTAPTSTIPHPVISPSMKLIGTRMGMVWGCAALGSLFGAPIAGALANIDAASFLHAQIFGGVTMAVGAVCLIWPLIAIRRYDTALAQARLTEAAAT